MSDIDIVLVREDGWENNSTATQIKGCLSYVNGDRIIRSFATIELPWKDNQTDISCIPAGTYKNIKRFSSDGKLGKRLEVPNVPGRTLIRIHAGTKPSHSHGCILLDHESRDKLWDDMNNKTAKLIIY